MFVGKCLLACGKFHHVIQLKTLPVIICCCHAIEIEFLCNVRTPHIGKNRHKLCAKYTVAGLQRVLKVGTICGKEDCKIGSTH
jgi:hypothetical protein